MKKTTIIAVFLAVLVIVVPLTAYFYSRIDKTPAEIKLMDIMEKTGATVLSREAYFWAKPQNGSRTVTAHDRLVTELAELLQIKALDEDHPVNVINSGNIQEIQANGKLPEGDMVNISGRLINHNGEKESHLIVDVTGLPGREKAGQIEKTVMRICRKYGLKPDVNYCIVGYFDGKLDTKELNEVCRKAFQAAGADKVDGIKDNNLISLTAYSPEIDNYVRVDGSRVNLNIAIRYNSYEKRTYIWLATPLISIEY